MSQYARVAISLPKDLLRVVERERRRSGESRSEFFRRAVVEVLTAERDQRKVDRYLRGYAAEPESREEVETEGAVGLSTLRREPS